VPMRPCACRASALHLLEDAARQRWGSVLAVSVSEASPAVDRLLRQQDLLLQLTLPPGTPLPSAPQTARVQVTDGTLISSHTGLPSPHADPRIQGLSFFYVASAATPRLVPGMNVLAYLPVGPQVSGVVIPAPAIVWGQGKTWSMSNRELIASCDVKFPQRTRYTMDVRHEGFSAGIDLWCAVRKPCSPRSFARGFRSGMKGARDMKPEETAC